MIQKKLKKNEKLLKDENITIKESKKISEDTIWLEKNIKESKIDIGEFLFDCIANFTEKKLKREKDQRGLNNREVKGQNQRRSFIKQVSSSCEYFMINDEDIKEKFKKNGITLCESVKRLYEENSQEYNMIYRIENAMIQDIRE